MTLSRLAGDILTNLERLAREAADHPRKEEHMATIDEAKAAFEQYHQAANARIAELEAAAAQSDAQSLVDEIAAAQAEIVAAPALADGPAPQ